MSESMTEDRKTPKGNSRADQRAGNPVAWTMAARSAAIYLGVSQRVELRAEPGDADTSHAAYRDGVLQIAQRLKKTVAVRAD